MRIFVEKTYDAMSQKAALLVSESIHETPGGLFSFPGGDTPLGMFRAFVDMVNSGAIDISRAHYVSLDEWAGLGIGDKGSCGLFNHENLLSKLRHPFASAHIINGAAASIEKERDALNAYISKWGPLSTSVLGIGLNGHIGFNEDGVDFNLDAHIIPLSDITKKIMHKYFDGKFNPEYGITQGIRQIMAAKQIVLLANGVSKADIVHRAMKGAISNEVPASILQRHPNCCVVLDEEAAGKLQDNPI